MNYFFIRHITSLGNIDPSIYHNVDDHKIDISGDHHHQAKEAVNKIVDLSDDIPNNKDFSIYYSPFLRTTKTKDLIVEEISHHQVFPKQYSNPLLVERKWGMLRHSVKTEKDTDKLFNFFYQPLDGESYLQCYQRVVTFDNMLKLKHKANDNIVIVAHGESIKCYLMHLLDWTPDQFEAFRSPDNGQVILVKDGILSAQTPLGIRVKPR
jgi:broad specificity phosphatase PhoE